MDRILITQPVTTLDGIVHVPPPIILGHVSERGIDTALGGDGVRTRGEELGDACCFESGFGETKGCSETGTTGAAGGELEWVGGCVKRDAYTTTASNSWSMTG